MPPELVPPDAVTPPELVVPPEEVTPPLPVVPPEPVDPPLLDPPEELLCPPDPGVSTLPAPQPIDAAVNSAAHIDTVVIVDIDGRKGRRRANFDILGSFDRLVIWRFRRTTQDETECFAPPAAQTATRRTS